MNIQTGWFQMWECGCTTLVQEWTEVPQSCPIHHWGEFAGSMPELVNVGEGATWGTEPKADPGQ